MMKMISFRWKTLFCACTMVLTVLTIIFFSTAKVTVSEFTSKFASKFTMQMLKKPNSAKLSASSETKLFSTNPMFNTKPVSETKSICRAFDKPSSNVTNTTSRYKGCSVPVFKSTYERDYYSRNSSCPKCTSALFKDYYRTHKALMAEGYWDIVYSGNKIEDATFRPPFCSFTRRNLDPDYSRKCFSRKRIRKIVALGDSIGRMTFTGMKSVLESTGIKQCGLEKTEQDGYFTNISYYLPAGTHIPPGYVSIGSRGCHSCNARQFRCIYESTDSYGLSHDTPLVLEHLPLSMILDTSVRILKPIASFTPTNYTQEFLFRDYLGATGQPDVLIIATPFLHEVRAKLERHGKAGLNGAIRKLVMILERYLPMSTEVYWVPSHYIFGGSELAAVNQCNEDLYEVLKAEFGDERSRMHGTFDLLRMSCPLVDLSLRGDPYHMKPKWYKVIGKHLLQLICN